MTMEFGLLLPHFGRHASPANLVEGARRAEALGYDSVWVRDHLIFEPHGEFEDPDNTFYESLTTLSVLGASTTRLRLGTGAMIPFRHPIHTARVTATMSQFFPRRLILGMGAGNSDHQFEELGLGDVFRPELVASNAAILRKLWSSDHVSYEDDHYRLTDVSISPKPAGGEVPFWYCGNTPASVRRAVEFCDGWLPGRIGILTLSKRVQSLQELSEEAGRDRPDVGVIPITSIAATRAEALSSIDVDGLLAWANAARFWVKPPSGSFQAVGDLEGLLLAGTGADIADQCLALRMAGVNHIVFDLRLSFERWFEQMELLSSEVVIPLGGGQHP